MLVKKQMICFDLDNTLIKSNKPHIKAFKMAFAKNKLRKLLEKKIGLMLNGRHANDVVKLLYPEINENDLANVIKDHQRFISKTGRYARKIGNVTATLRRIKKSYKIALVSNCTHKEINALLKGAKLDKKMFNYIVGKDDVPHTKPCPDEIFRAENLAHLHADFIVGDSIYDIIAAKRAGIKSISVLTGVTNRKEIMAHKPDYILNNVNELPKLLCLE